MADYKKHKKQTKESVVEYVKSNIPDKERETFNEEKPEQKRIIE